MRQDSRLRRLSSGHRIPCRAPEPTSLHFCPTPSDACMKMPPNSLAQPKTPFRFTGLFSKPNSARHHALRLRVVLIIQHVAWHRRNDLPGNAELVLRTAVQRDELESIETESRGHRRNTLRTRPTRIVQTGRVDSREWGMRRASSHSLSSCPPRFTRNVYVLKAKLEEHIVAVRFRP